MCISAAIAWAGANAAAITATAAVVGAAGAIYGANEQRKDAKEAAGAQGRADALAAGSANARLAQRRRALSSQSLLTGGGDALSSGVLGGGKPTLGG